MISLGKKQNKFVHLLVEHAKAVQKGMVALHAFMQDPIDEHAKAVEDAEKDADEVRRILVDELNRSFVTPFDREDIFALSRAIDDVIDYANTTIHEMEVLKIDPDPFLVDMTALLADAARELALAMERLEHHPTVASEHARRAKSAENRIEKEYRNAVAKLFEGADDIDDILKILKYREIYRHISNAADRADEAGNIIGDVVVKMT
jgi:predicted phosphate transport protein (TIGR00153 family)